MQRPVSAPLFTVVIPNWNGLRYLPTCLASLQTQSQRSFEVIVVDNGSSDGSCDWMTKEHPWAQQIRLEGNCGFPAAVNRGIEAGRGRYVVLLNNDTQCAPTWLEALERGLDQFAGAGFAASRILEMPRQGCGRAVEAGADDMRIAAAGDVCLRNGVAYSRGKGEPASSHCVPEFVFGASACASVYRRECLERVGPFDEDFYFSFEDVDWSFRAQLQGICCVYLPEAVVYHLGSGSIFNLRVHKMALYHMNRNQIWFVLKNFPAPLLRKYGREILRAQVRIVLSHFFHRHPGFPRLAVQAKLAALGSLPVLLRKRRAVQQSRTVSIDYLESLLLPPPAYEPALTRLRSLAGNISPVQRKLRAGE